MVAFTENCRNFWPKCNDQRGHSTFETNIVVHRRNNPSTAAYFTYAATNVKVLCPRAPDLQTGERVMSYAGTDDSPDLVTDAWQGLLSGTIQYSRAVTDSLSAKAEFGPIDHFTGHSLGGGLASLAALANRKRATTFNAAGLHSWTTDSWGVDLDKANATIDAYRVQGDFLSTIQDAGPAYMAAGLLGYAGVGSALFGLAGAVMPNGVGTAFWLQPTSNSIWNRHKMVTDVIPGIMRA